MKFRVLRLLPFLLFALLVIFLWRGLSLDPKNLPSVQLGQPVPVFDLPVLNEENKQFRSGILRGQVSLLNVWASWCEACVEEQYFLMSLAKEGIPIFGINYKDDSSQATQWLSEWGNPYQIIGTDKDGKVAIDLGVYGAPETFLIDRNGIIRYRHAGILDKQSWSAEFLPRIRELNATS